MFPTRCFPARLHISDITGAFGNLAVHGQQDSRCVGCRDSSLSADESSASAKDVDIRAPDDFLGSGVKVWKESTVDAEASCPHLNTWTEISASVRAGVKTCCITAASSPSNRPFHKPRAPLNGEPT